MCLPIGKSCYIQVAHVTCFGGQKHQIVVSPYSMEWLCFYWTDVCIMVLGDLAALMFSLSPFFSLLWHQDTCWPRKKRNVCPLILFLF
jgi:hypothetical protein